MFSFLLALQASCPWRSLSKVPKATRPSSGYSSATPARPPSSEPAPPAMLRPFLLHPLRCYWNSHSNQCMMVLVSHIIFFFGGGGVVVCKDGGGVLRRLGEVISIVILWFLYLGKNEETCIHLTIGPQWRPLMFPSISLSLSGTSGFQGAGDKV